MQRQEDLEFEARLDYIKFQFNLGYVRSCLKKKSF